MIGVIADDLTGAAEIGAVGLRHGLRAEVLLGGEPSGDADLVCLDTDSRPCAPGEAAERAARSARRLRQQRADWLYKKTDSVLRGNVTPELEAVINELGLDGALLVAANPSLGRTIVRGQYFVRGQLLHETEFARDPKYPRGSSDVRRLVAAPATLPLFVRRGDEGLPERGIVIGEAASSDDLRKWAAQRSDGWLMAGGAEFFGALLNRPASNSQAELHSAGKELFVCGSASEASRNFVAFQAEQGVPVFSLPNELISAASINAGEIDALAEKVATALQSAPRVVLHVGRTAVKRGSLAALPAIQLVSLATEALRRTDVAHVLAEGGATAVALAQQMGWNRLRVIAELAPGVVTLLASEPASPWFTMKPGSYSWPDNLTGSYSC